MPEENMKFEKISSALVCTLLFAVSGAAGAADDAGWYGGLNVGQSKAEIDDARITSGLLAGGLGTTSISDDDSDVGYKVFGGYKFNRFFAVEGGYFDLGKFGFTANTVPLGTLSGNIRLRGVNLDLLGMLPITTRLSAFGRVGVNYAEARDSFSSTGAVSVLDTNPKERDTNYKFGGGMQFDFTRSLGMRLEAERYRVNDAVGNKGDVDLISLGLVYRFGAASSAPAPRAASAPIVATPAPAPPAVLPPPPAPRPAPAPPPTPRKVTFSADSLFDFGKSTVNAAGKQALDKFAADLKGTNFEVITATGHTDRIGSPASNMALSKRRAEAVQAYLMESAAIPAGKISAQGKGESEPVTKVGDCKGDTATKQLIACLQPDRRVEVEVSGTR
jgi:OOP family OmpA-OmpF porin